MNVIEATAGEIATAVAGGSISATEVCQAFLGRIDAFEPTIRAFSHLDPDDALAQAKRIDARPEKGALAGIPVGVKDIYDTAGMPTEFFSPIYAGNRPSRDAAVIARLRAAGAVVIGKTTTTEFAYMHTGSTLNPHDLSRTPGSSSAGSGAGMAAGFFPLALGSQTAGSLLKPASFCGVFAFKPTARLVSTEGVKPLAPSFDTVGWYGRCVDDLARVAGVLIPRFPSVAGAPSRLRLAFANTPKLGDVDPALRAIFMAACERLRAAGHLVEEMALPDGFDGIYEHHRIINDAEGARSLAVEHVVAPELLSEETLGMIERAGAISWEAELTAREAIAALARVTEPLVARYDAVLDLATAVPALSGLSTTGPSDFIKAWMCLGLPQVGLPAMTSPEGLPFGLQLVAPRYGDARVLSVARSIAEVLDCARLKLAPLT